MKQLYLILAFAVLLLTGCGGGGQIMDGDGMLNSYRQITQEEAMQMMEQDAPTVVFIFGEKDFLWTQVDCGIAVESIPKTGSSSFTE